MLVIIDNYDSFTYNLYQIVAQNHPEVVVLRNDKVTVAEVLAMNPQGIILSPGPGRPEAAGICMDLIQALPPTLPLFGVCLGLQAIVAAFGGHVIAAPELVHGKATLIFHQRKALYQGLPLPFSAGRYHSLLAERESLPLSLQIESETAEGLIMGIRHRQLPIFGVQFHPESILTPLGTHIIQNFMQVCGLEKAGVLCA
jgi:anthranilate synthase/aminodeoxychorismate synthase-like glutamine amidotransferase